jgi:hypothetical protein
VPGRLPWHSSPRTARTGSWTRLMSQAVNQPGRIATFGETTPRARGEHAPAASSASLRLPGSGGRWDWSGLVLDADPAQVPRGPAIVLRWLWEE